MGIPWDPWDPSLSHSHAHLYSDAHCFHMSTAIKQPAPDRVKLRAERQSARMLKIAGFSISLFSACFTAFTVCMFLSG